MRYGQFGHVIKKWPIGPTEKQNFSHYSIISDQWRQSVWEIQEPEEMVQEPLAYTADDIIRINCQRPWHQPGGWQGFTLLCPGERNVSASWLCLKSPVSKPTGHLFYFESWVIWEGEKKNSKSPLALTSNVGTKIGLLLHSLWLMLGKGNLSGAYFSYFSRSHLHVLYLSLSLCLFERSQHLHLGPPRLGLSSEVRIPVRLDTRNDP